MNDTSSFPFFSFSNNGLWIKYPRDTPLHVLEEAAYVAIGVINSWYMKQRASELERLRPRGRFVVVEGIDGSGKTTQIERLRDWLPGSGLMPEGAKLVVTREPGGTAFGEALRELLLHPPQAQVPGERAELLLYAADRAQHVAERIAPALEAGHWVLSDRFSGSTEAYQGHGRGLDLAAIRQLERFATAGLQPDLTLWLDVPLEVALERQQRRRRDRIEAEGEDFLRRVHDGYSKICENSRHWAAIDASGTEDEIFRQCTEALSGFMA